MSKQKPYVLDTNILIDCVDIIPDKTSRAPEEPTLDLSDAHIIIPTVVIRELSSFKKENSDRGRTARTALRRIRNLFEAHLEENRYTRFEEEKFYSLEYPMTTSFSAQTFSILPISKADIKSKFKPAENDMDGQIILTAIVATELTKKEAVLLTNDNGLAIRAIARGIKTSRYGYKNPKPYTGRRDLNVPEELLSHFLSEGEIPNEVWKKFMPNEPPLIANEFIIMTPRGEFRGYDPKTEYFSNIGRYDAEVDSIVHLKYLSDFPCCAKNPGQAIYAEALMSPEIPVVICTGPAGSGKTFMAAIYAYHACKSGQYIGATVVPCNVEDSVGYLPGDLNEKLDPNVQPIKNALRNYLIKNDKDVARKMRNSKKFGQEEVEQSDPERNSNQQAQKSIKARLKNQVELIWENWFDNVPIEYARGRDFAYEVAIYDEFQDQNRSQADTLIKRIGQDGKIIITGDIEQIHAAYLDRENNGLVYARNQLLDSPLVAQVTFTEDEVVRHPLVHLIAKRQTKTPPAR